MAEVLESFGISREWYLLFYLCQYFKALQWSCCIWQIMAVLYYAGAAKMLQNNGDVSK